HVYSREFLDSPRESPWGTTQRAQKQGLELTRDDYGAIDAYCRERGIDWFASAWDLESYQFLQSFDLPFNKVASPMVASEPLLRAIAADRKHTFIATGMSTLTDIDRAVNIFRAAECPFELMHCVSAYPLADEQANLRAIPALRTRYSCNVGYSSHEVGLAVSCGAAALGITSLERHITLDRAMYGSDQAVSLEPASFHMLVQTVRTIHAALGDGVIGRPSSEELSTATRLRAHRPSDTSEID
ncbi:MAG: N-acetylneuraminate synthase family protein, partial [Candidatus Binatia bacterium]